MKRCPLLWAGLGFFAGLAFGILVAPESGYRTREFIGEVVTEYTRMARVLLMPPGER
ncbi:MAG: YtxH domain-containing protein [Candidatus Eremiobacteraeota bacterium]|nr:YtxH domain-containing protein [Candidatus Eremiobacteraeota bacterium]